MISVLTYIYNNAEPLRVPLIRSRGIKYVCVTDNKRLRAPGWKVIYEPLPNITDVRLKFAYVKLHPFLYTSTEHTIVVDGTTEIVHDPRPLVELTGEGLALKLHPVRNNLIEELCAWQKHRGLSKECANRYLIMASIMHSNLFEGPLYESNCSCWYNSSINKLFGDTAFKTMLQLSNGDDVFKSNQLVMSLLLQTVFADHIQPVTFDQEQWFVKHKHGKK